eukprot:CFRG3116T1
MSVPRTLIVGLGNFTMPNTRHSIGMLFVDYVAQKYGAAWETSRSIYGTHAKCRIQKSDGTDHELLFLKPKLFMNINGKSVNKACTRLLNGNWEGKNQLYLVHDELEKPFGKWVFKEQGSAAGHNGVRSVHTSLGSQDIPRLRIGIGKPTGGRSVADYVLQGFSKSERDILPQLLEQCTADLILRLHEK